jgi:hypothetical protein
MPRQTMNLMTLSIGNVTDLYCDVEAWTRHKVQVIRKHKADLFDCDS